MRNNKSVLSKQLSVFIPMTTLLLLFQFGFSAFVNCINPDVQGYTTAAVLCLAVGIGTVLFTVKYQGDLVCSFIFAVLLMFGAALQATRDNTSNYIRLMPLWLAFMFAAFIAVDLFVKKDFIEKYRKLAIIVLCVASVGLMGLLLVAGRGGDETKAGIEAGDSLVQLTELLKVLFVCFITVLFASKKTSDAKKLIFGTVFIGIVGAFMLLIGEMGTMLVLGFVYVIIAFLFIKDRKLWLKYLVFILCMVVVLVILISFVNTNFKPEEETTTESATTESITKENVTTADGETAEDESSQKNTLENLKKKVEEVIDSVYNVTSRLEERWNAYVRPEDFSDREATQLLNAQKAMAKGGMLGSQTNLYVYSFHADMIFPYIMMRLGFIVGLFVIAAYVIFYFRMQKNITKQTDIYRYTFLVASLSILMMQMLIIAFGSLNFIPLTGIPMPLLSHGGMAMMVNFAFYGLLIRESCQKEFNIIKAFDSFMRSDKKATDKPKNIKHGKRVIVRPEEENSDEKVNKKKRKNSKKKTVALTELPTEDVTEELLEYTDEEYSEEYDEELMGDIFAQQNEESDDEVKIYEGSKASDTE